MEKIKIDNETIYLNKSKLFGWTVIKPYKIDGKINWRNLILGGSWTRFFIVVFAVILIIGCIKEYTTAVRIANECIARLDSMTNLII